MRIVVIGAGGLGSKLGAHLVLGGAEVWFVNHNSTYVDAVESAGLQYRTEGETRNITNVRAVTSPSSLPSNIEVALITVKSYNTLEAVRALKPHLSDTAIAITLQNGLGNVECIAAELGKQRALVGVTTEGATLEGPGVALDMGHGVTYLGGSADDARLMSLCKLFREGGLQCELDDAIDGLLWAKLCVSSGINALAVVVGVTNGYLKTIDECRAVALSCIGEAMSVAARKEIGLAFDPLARFDAVTVATFDMFSGSLLDASRGRATEVPMINGAIVREGQSLGLPLPVNAVVCNLVRAIERVAEAPESNRLSRYGIQIGATP